MSKATAYALIDGCSDPRGTPLSVADAMESLFNSTFDHRGAKPALPYATEADVQGLLTMLFMTWLSGGNPPLFMDFRKVWEPPEIQSLAKKLTIKATGEELWWRRGLVDGDNSGSVPEYATMAEYKQYAPANHFHMTWQLPVARLQHWMDMTGVLSVTPWSARPAFVAGVDRPRPLVQLIEGR